MGKDPFYKGYKHPSGSLGGTRAKKIKITLLALGLLILLALAVAAFFHFNSSNNSTNAEASSDIDSTSAPAPIPPGMREWTPTNGDPFTGKIKTVASNGRFALFEDPSGETFMLHIEDFSAADQEEIRGHETAPGQKPTD
ncbi:MAG: hypothetical protein AAF591_05275 [Verrucomicrobiota bacterium]